MSQIVSLCLEEELKRNKKLKQSDIDYLKEWNEKQPHLPRISDSSIAAFLHNNGYHIEAAKANIENYYTFRTRMPEFFANKDTLNAKDLRKIFYVVYVIPLEKMAKDGRQILFIKLLDTDPNKFVFNEYVKFLLMVIDLWLYKRGLGDGHITVVDVQDISLKHATRFNPSSMKRYYTYLQEGLPVQLKEIHFVNVTRGMETILNISKPFMNKKLLDALHLHPTIESLRKFVPIKLLPNELGGKAGRLMDLHEALIKELEEHQNWFLEEELRSKVDETKRLDISKTAKDTFGADGSFKKLDLD